MVPAMGTTSAPGMDFLVIGAQKCATSWLYYCLRDHPALHLPLNKREVEYLGGDLHRRHGTSWYFDLVAGAGDGQLRGDVSVQYQYDERSAEVVRGILPDVRLLVSLRHPVDRAVSAAQWSSRKGRLPHGIDTVIGGALDALVADPRDDEQAKLAEVVERGYYDSQLARYVDRFPPEHIMVLLYDEIAQDAAATLARVYRFLGVDPDFRPASLERRPKQNSNADWLIRLERLAPRSRWMGSLTDRLNQVLVRVGGGTRAPALPPALRSRLMDVYRPHIERTQAIIERLPQSQRPAGDLRLRWQ